MLHRIPERLNRLRRDHRLAATAHRRRDHHRQLFAVLVKDFANRHQRGLCIQRIEDRLHQQQVRAARNQRTHLLRIRLSSPGRMSQHAKAGIVRVRRVRERYRQRPNRAGHKSLPSRFIGHTIRPLAALPRGLLVDLPRQITSVTRRQSLLIKSGSFRPPCSRGSSTKTRSANARRAKGIRLDDVRTRFKKPPVNIADHLRLRQRKEIAVVQQILRRVLEPLPANIRFLHPIGADRRAHRSIDDGNTAFQYLLQGMGVVANHIFLVVYSGGILNRSGKYAPQPASNTNEYIDSRTPL
jgi:hypothetical protein